MNNALSMATAREYSIYLKISHPKILHVITLSYKTSEFMRQEIP